MLYSCTLSQLGRGSRGAALCVQVWQSLLAAPGRNVQIVRPLEDVEVMEKEGASFSCEVSHDEVPAQWFREGSKLRPSDNVRIRQEGATRIRGGRGRVSPPSLPCPPPPELSGLCSQEGHTFLSTGGYWPKTQGKSNLWRKMQNRELSSE